MSSPEKHCYQVHEFAQLSGVTVRALHHYDREGLLKPAARSAAGYRLYSDRDLVRLEQIVVLKFLGFSLREIHRVLKAEKDLPETLRHQADVLAEKRRQLDAAILAIHRALRTVTQTGASDWQQLANIIKEITMQADKSWMGKYFSDQAKRKIQERKSLWSPELQERSTRRWEELYRDVEAALGENPASARAQELVARWDELVREFTGGDAQIEKGLKAMFQDREHWPEEYRKKMPVMRPEAHEFLQRAREAGAVKV